MVYVFDAGPFITLFTYFYASRFPSLWERFNTVIASRRVLSTREVANEIMSFHGKTRLTQWVSEQRDLFDSPSQMEIRYVEEIFRQPHFRQLIDRRKMLEGRPVADPFVIAKARTIGGIVVTTEKYKPNAAQIPNICEHFGIGCIGLEGFMEREGWCF